MNGSLRIPAGMIFKWICLLLTIGECGLPAASPIATNQTIRVDFRSRAGIISKAVLNSEGALEILQIDDSTRGLTNASTRPLPIRAMGLTIPKPKVGRSSLTNNPGLQISFTRNAWSSDLQDHFAARSDMKGSSISVQLDTIESIGGAVRGWFEAVLTNHRGETIQINRSTFDLTLSAQGKPNPDSRGLPLPPLPGSNAPQVVKPSRP